MPSRAEIVSFDDSPPPPGADPWVPGAAPASGIEVTDADPAWPRQYDDLAGRIRQALGWRVLQLEHVGSTSVPGLAAKPVIDIEMAGRGRGQCERRARHAVQRPQSSRSSGRSTSGRSSPPA